MKPTSPSDPSRPKRGWWLAPRWLLARRLTQAGILGLFLLPALPGASLGGWWAKWVETWPGLEGTHILNGNLSASLLLDTVPMTDPYLLLQGLLTGHLPVWSGFIGGLIVVGFYALVGGRVYCSWVCPVNPVSDGAAWLRRRLKLDTPKGPDRSTRYWILGLTLVLALTTGQIAWELVNPVSMTHRGILYGIGGAWLVLLGVALFDLLASRRGWCGSLCPVGAFYGLMGSKALVRVVAADRERCDDCLDCFAVCPEPQVIKPALKGAARGIGPVILDRDCTNCGRCIDVCEQRVFRFGSRFAKAAIDLEPEPGVSGSPQPTH